LAKIKFDCFCLSSVGKTEAWLSKSYLTGSIIQIVAVLSSVWASSINYGNSKREAIVGLHDADVWPGNLEGM